MGGLPRTVTNESIFRIPVPAKNSRHVPENNKAEAVRRAMASSDWLKLAPFVCLALKVYLKINPFFYCAGAQPQSNRSTLLSNSLDNARVMIRHHCVCTRTGNRINLLVHFAAREFSLLLKNDLFLLQMYRGKTLHQSLWGKSEEEGLVEAIQNYGNVKL